MPNREKERPKITTVDAALLVALVAFHAAVNCYYLAIDNQPPGWDQSYHLLQSQDYARIAAHLNRNMPLQLLNKYSFYPPLVYLATGPLYALFGFSEDVATYVNIPFLAVAIFCTYGIGLRLVGRRTALIAAALFSFYPSIFGLSREYMIETALVATVSLTNYWAIRTSLRTHRQAVIYGVFLSLALLTKFIAPLFTAGPLLYVLIRAGGRSLPGAPRDGSNVPIHTKAGLVRSLVRARVGQVAAMSAAILTVAGLWYIPHLREISRDLTFNSNGGYIPQAGLSLTSFGYYPGVLVNIAMFVPLALLTIPGALYLSLKNRQAGLLLALWGLPAYVALSVVPLKDVRWIVPVLPALALVSSSWIPPVLGRQKWSRTARGATASALAVIMVFAGINFVTITLGNGALPSGIIVGTPFGPAVLYNSSAQEAQPASPEDWHVQGIVLKIAGNWDQPRPAYVTVLANSYRFSPAAFTYYTNRYSLPLEFHVVAGVDTKYQNFSDQFLHSDFIITKTGDLGILYEKEMVQTTLAMQYISSSDSQFTSSFHVLGRYPLPDYTTATLYIR